MTSVGLRFGLRLPVAFGQDLRAGFDGEQAVLARPAGAECGAAEELPPTSWRGHFATRSGA